MSSRTHETQMTTDDGQSPTNGWFDRIDTVRQYIAGLGFSPSRQSVEHATHAHHEDVPDELGTPTEETLATAGTTESNCTWIPVVDARCPDRLQSLFPPANYGAVVPRCIYRSSYPEPKNYKFLRDLDLKTIITLVPEKISREYEAFMKEAGIQHFQVHINANKGEVRVQSCDMSRALRLIMDRSNHPILIHCNKGKHRTGCTVACFRRIQGYDIEQIREEYHTYADPKARFFDEVFFEHFDLNTVMWLARQEKWVLPVTDVAPPSPPPSPIPSFSVARSRA